jgi:hypothetical protein
MDDEPEWSTLAQVRGFLAVDTETPVQRAALERFVDDLHALREAGGGEIRLGYRDLTDQDWSQSRKKYFRPRTLTPGLVVAPRPGSRPRSVAKRHTGDVWTAALAS